MALKRRKTLHQKYQVIIALKGYLLSGVESEVAHKLVIILLDQEILLLTSQTDNQSSKLTAAIIHLVVHNFSEIKISESKCLQRYRSISVI